MKKNTGAGELLARALPFIERLLAAQGDHAETELIALQHEVAEFFNRGNAEGRKGGGLPANKPPPATVRPSSIFRARF